MMLLKSLKVKIKGGKILKTRAGGGTGVFTSLFPQSRHVRKADNSAGGQKEKEA